MGTSNVKLLGVLESPFSLRVQMALNIKSVNYEFLEENLSSKSELLLQSNPVHETIPVLIHGDKPICESLIIVHYIDEVWTSGPCILPSDPYDRAIARFWAAYIDEKLFPSLKVFGMTRDDEAKTVALEQVVAGLVLLEGAFVKCSRGKAFFGGDNIGYLDIVLGCSLPWLRVTEEKGGVQLLDEIKTPCLMGWAERFCSDDAVKDAIMQMTEKINEIARLYYARAKAPTN